MKKMFLVGLGISLFVSAAHADYDDAACRKNTMLDLMGLGCISRGIQDYYSTKTQDMDNPPQIVPSEKWLALLGMMETQTGRLDLDPTTGRPNKRERPDQVDSIVTSPDAKEIFQRDIIMKIQAYGFCTSYVSKETNRATGGKACKDLSADDWNCLRPTIAGRMNLDTIQLQKMAEFFGFKSSDDMRNLTIGLNDPNHSIFWNSTFQERRKSFAARLDQEIASGIASKDNGLKVCMEQMQRTLSGTSGDPIVSKFLANDHEGLAFCRNMADSCEIDAGFCAPYKPAQRGSGGGIRVTVPLAPPMIPPSQGLPKPPVPGQQ